MGASHSNTRVLALLAGLIGLAATSAVKAAGATPFAVVVEPRTVRPGDVVLVTVKTRTPTVAAEIAPTVTAALGDRKVHLRPVRGGFQGIAAVPNQPVSSPTLEVRVAAGDAEVVQAIALEARTVEEVALTVEEEFVDPPPEIRKVIEADRAAIAAAFRPVAPDLVVHAPFIWPRPRRITAPFGQRRMFNGTLNSEHQGIDLPGKPGDDVRAANEGTVVLSRELFYSGKTVLIDHGGGVFTGYFHLSDLGVTEGDVIARGKVIGQVGSTGRVTGPHLHYAVRVDGQYVDPASFMKLRLRPPRAETVDIRAARLER